MSSFDPSAPEHLLDSEAASKNEAIYNQLQMSADANPFDAQTSSSSSPNNPYGEEKGGRASVSADGKVTLHSLTLS